MIFSRPWWQAPNICSTYKMYQIKATNKEDLAVIQTQPCRGIIVRMSHKTDKFMCHKCCTLRHEEWQDMLRQMRDLTDSVLGSMNGASSRTKSISWRRFFSSALKNSKCQSKCCMFNKPCTPFQETGGWCLDWQIVVLYAVRFSVKDECLSRFKTLLFSSLVNETKM